MWEVPELYIDEATVRITAYLDGGIRGSDVSESSFSISLGDVARQNYPNPFAETTSISYSLTRPGKVKISIFDSQGTLVRIVEETERPRGNYIAEWDGTGSDGAVVSSGVYFCKIEAGSVTSTKKIILLK